MNKRSEFTAALALYAPELVCITEIAPKHTQLQAQESEFQVEGYDICTNLDHSKRGVAIYTAKHLKASPADVSRPGEYDECCWVEVDLKDKDKLLIGCVYRSPNSDTVNNAKLLSGLKRICELKKYSHLLVCGDFNIPDIDWVEELTPQSTTNIGYMFMECIRDCYLTQHVKFPTHRRGDQKANVLDLVLSTEEGMVSNLTMEAPLGKSHHCSLLFDFNCYTDKPRSSIKKPLYSKGDYEGFRAEMTQYDWVKDMEGKSSGECWQLFEERVTSGIDKFIPKRSVNYAKPGRPLWMNSDALKKVKKKTESYKRYVETREGKEYLEYAKARNQARWECRKAKRDFEKQLAREAKTNPKAFYNYANSKLKTKAGIASLDTDNGAASSDAQKAEVLNEFFSSVFTREDKVDMPEFDRGEDIKIPLENLNISEDMVKKKLDKINPSKSPGPDGLHPRVLKELSPEISKPLAFIMQKSLDEGILPQSWKDAHVTPIFKKGSRTNKSNYRPVSLTSVVCKQMESIIRDHVMQYILDNDILTKCQHGFVSGRSCSTQLLQCLDVWTSLLDKGSCLDAIYLDFAKAFDSVPHERLLTKLEGYGIGGKIQNWIRDFLFGRRQKVVVNGEMSNWSSVLSGVPQGSVLGPILFVLFVNDMPDVVHSLIGLFADDAKVFREIGSDEDHKMLQDDLNNLQKWAQTWQLKFNATKCKVMHLGHNNPCHSYKMEGNVTLESVDSEKDLGVLVDKELKMDTHTEHQVNKANRILGLIRRSFDSLDAKSLVTLYKSLVRPHLEYCNAITFPQLVKQVKLLEGVQRRATKLVQEVKELGYTDRMKHLRLPSLHYRRTRGDMIETYKYIHKIYKVEPCPFTIDTNRRTRGHSLKIEKRQCNKNIKQKFFTSRAVNHWNGLPETVVQAPTTDSFKNRLDSHWGKHWYSLDPL